MKITGTLAFVMAALLATGCKLKLPAITAHTFIQQVI